MIIPLLSSLFPCDSHYYPTKERPSLSLKSPNKKPDELGRGTGWQPSWLLQYNLHSRRQFSEHNSAEYPIFPCFIVQQCSTHSQWFVTFKRSWLSSYHHYPSCFYRFSKRCWYHFIYQLGKGCLGWFLRKSLGHFLPPLIMIPCQGILPGHMRRLQ